MKKRHYQRIITSISTPGMIVFSFWLLYGCVSMAPVNSSFDSAKTLDKRQVEMMGHYSSYYLNSEDEVEGKKKLHVNNNWGFRLGYGISKRIDLKFRYERLFPVLQEDKDQLDGANYFALTPRYCIMKDHITGALDLGLYSYRLKEDNQAEQLFFLSPRLMFTYPSGKYLDLTLSGKIDIFPWDGDVFGGLNLGCGISSNMDIWSFRPEIGLINDFSGTTWFNGGLALVLKFNIRKTANLN
jgi:hypothetical protein